MATKRKEEWEKIQRKGMKYNVRPNTYDLTSKEYGIGYCKNGSEFCFDKEDYDKIKDYCWYEVCKTKYIATSILGKKITINNFLISHKNNEIIDHYNRKKFDNRKENLIIIFLNLILKRISLK